MTPFISVVMPVRNEARFIRETLLRLTEQNYPDDCYEVIVADGMSEDGTREIVLDLAKKFPQVRLLDNPKRLSSAGRNVGFKEGRGDYFLVVDGHCYIPDDKLLQNVADCFEKSAADCLGRPQPLDPPVLTNFQKSVASVRASRMGHGGDSLIYSDYEGVASPVSNGAAYKREVFALTGSVDEAFDAAEDVEFNYRVEKAGLKCYTSPLLTIRYYPRENLQGLLRQMIRYGKGRFKFIMKHREALTVNQLIPAFFVCGLILLLLSLVMYFGFGLLAPLGFLVTLYGIYLFLVLAVAIKLAINNEVQSFCSVPAIIFTIHFGLGFGFVSQAFRWVCTPFSTGSNR